MATNAIFGFSTQQVVLLAHKIYIYLGKIDNTQRLSVVATPDAKGQKVNRKKDIDDDDILRYTILSNNLSNVF